MQAALEKFGAPLLVKATFYHFDVITHGVQRRCVSAPAETRGAAKGRKARPPKETTKQNLLLLANIGANVENDSGIILVFLFDPFPKHVILWGGPEARPAPVVSSAQAMYGAHLDEICLFVNSKLWNSLTLR